jgi:hypothetical protein
MVREAAPLDVSTIPELARLAEEVARTGRARLLRQHDTDLAILAPVAPRRRSRTGRTAQRTKPDTEAVMALAGAWQGEVDTEQLKRDLDAARGDNRPPVVL